MNYTFFIAKRLIDTKSYKNSISAPIIKIGIIAIALSMVVMLIAIATGLGLKQKIKDKVVAFNGHITIERFGINESENSLNSISKNQDFYPNFSAVDEITHIQAVAKKFGVIRTDSDFEGMFLKGVGSDYNWSYLESFITSGTIPNYDESYSNEVLISNYLSNRLGFKVGDSFHMYFLKSDYSKPPNVIKYTVSGIFNSGFETLDKTYVIGDINHIQRLNKWRKDEVGNFELFVSDFESLESIGQIVYEETPSNLNTQTVKQKYATIFDWIEIFDKNTFAILAIMIFVAVINIITALLVLILERTHMIGVLKAVGSSNWAVRQIFLYNASYLVGLGLFWGNLIGLSFLFFQKHFKIISLDPSNYYVSTAPIFIEWYHILALNLCTFLLCLFFLLIPSYLITKIPPIKAIKFK